MGTTLSVIGNPNKKPVNGRVPLHLGTWLRRSVSQRGFPIWTLIFLTSGRQFSEMCPWLRAETDPQISPRISNRVECESPRRCPKDVGMIDRESKPKCLPSARGWQPSRRGLLGNRWPSDHESRQLHRSGLWEAVPSSQILRNRPGTV
jgi:hypothetical protein